MYILKWFYEGFGVVWVCCICSCVLKVEVICYDYEGVWDFFEVCYFILWFWGWVGGIYCELFRRFKGVVVLIMIDVVVS